VGAGQVAQRVRSPPRPSEYQRHPLLFSTSSSATTRPHTEQTDDAPGSLRSWSAVASPAATGRMSSSSLSTRRTSGLTNRFCVSMTLAAVACSCRRRVSRLAQRGLGPGNVGHTTGTHTFAAIIDDRCKPHNSISVPPTSTATTTGPTAGSTTAHCAKFAPRGTMNKKPNKKQRPSPSTREGSVLTPGSRSLPCREQIEPNRVRR